MEQSSVSVIIPAYRAQKTIANAVNSALQQTAPPMEVLVIDDGSPEDLAATLLQFGDRVKLIRKANGGAANARNLGIDLARGEWIAFLDSDDYWEPGKLERQLAVGDGVGLVGARWFEQESGTPRSVARVLNPEFFGNVLKPIGPHAFQVAMNCWTGTLVVRREVVGNHRFASGLEPAEDRDLWIRLINSTSVFLIPEPLATYVQYPDSLSNSDADRDCGNMLKVVRRHASLLGPGGVREQEAIVYRRWASRHLATGKPRSAVAPALARLKLQPTSPQAWWIVAKSFTQSLIRLIR